MTRIDPFNKNLFAFSVFIFISFSKIVEKMAS